ncbi:MAG: nicotinate-nucleotide--dimethylbenzimidazole phosphoribosyltransferase [Candidatus Omnitrophota bacterium]
MKLLNETLKNIRATDAAIAEEAQARLDDLTKPRGSLGRLEELAKKVVGITRDLKPAFRRKVIFTLAGDHGVADEGVSLFPQEVTPQMVANFINGGAGINVLARHIGAEVIVVDMGVRGDLDIKDGRLKLKKINHGTENMAKGPAMTRDEAIKAIEAGIEVFGDEFAAKKIDITGTGDMGIANTTPSAAIVSCIAGVSVSEVTGRGTGIGDEQLGIKIRTIEEALKINNPDPKDPIDVLSKVGGYEIAGICGVILAAAKKSIPVVIDGFISTAGALIAYKLEPKAADYMFAAHRSQEKGHAAALKHLGLRPILDLDMRLGEGTGAALAINIIEAGIKILNEMASFSQANVSKEL